LARHRAAPRYGRAAPRQSSRRLVHRRISIRKQAAAGTIDQGPTTLAKSIVSIG